MRLDLYQAETAIIAEEQTRLLDDAREILLSERTLSRLEQNGVLHSIQVLVENAIGKAKQIIKASGKAVPVSAYDSFMLLSDLRIISETELPLWNAAIGLRNRIVHDYMNIDLALVMNLVKAEQYRFVTDFLLQPIKLSEKTGNI